MKIDFKGILDYGWDNWAKSATNALKTLLNGICAIVFYVVGGVVVLLYNVFCTVCGFVKKYPIPFLVALSLVLFIMWITTFVDLSIKARTYEWQRDSISYELYKIQQNYNLDTDTVSQNYHVR